MKSFGKYCFLGTFIKMLLKHKSNSYEIVNDTTSNADVMKYEISQWQWKIFSQWFDCYVFPVLGLLGLLGNFLAIIILSWSKLLKYWPLKPYFITETSINSLSLICALGFQLLYDLELSSINLVDIEKYMNAVLHGASALAATAVLVDMYLWIYRPRNFFLSVHVRRLSCFAIVGFTFAIDSILLIDTTKHAKAVMRISLTIMLRLVPFVLSFILTCKLIGFRISFFKYKVNIPANLKRTFTLKRMTRPDITGNKETSKQSPTHSNSLQEVARRNSKYLASKEEPVPSTSFNAQQIDAKEDKPNVNGAVVETPKIVAMHLNTDIMLHQLVYKAIKKDSNTRSLIVTAAVFICKDIPMAAHYIYLNIMVKYYP